MITWMELIEFENNVEKRNLTWFVVEEIICYSIEYFSSTIRSVVWRRALKLKFKDCQNQIKSAFHIIGDNRTFKTSNNLKDRVSEKRWATALKPYTYPTSFPWHRPVFMLATCEKPSSTTAPQLFMMQAEAELIMKRQKGVERPKLDFWTTSLANVNLNWALSNASHPTKRQAFIWKYEILSIIHLFLSSSFSLQVLATFPSSN